MNWKRFFTGRKIIIYIIILAVGGFAASRIFGGGGTENILTDTVKRQDVKRTVLATGQVVSETDLSLSFKSSGRVSQVSTRVGSAVSTGQILATLDQQSELAALKSAQGALASARANYQKVLEGASSEEIAVALAAVNAAEVTLANAKIILEDTKAKQDVLVENAYRALLNTTLTARVVSLYDAGVALAVSGTYTGNAEGQYNITLSSSGNVAFYYNWSGLESGSGLISRGTALPLGTHGLYITFSTSGTLTLPDSWVVEIPNKQSVNYVTNYNAYQSAVNTRASAIADATAAVASAGAVLAQRQADLDLKRVSARPSEIGAAEAQVLSAEGQLASAQSALANTIIRAPSSGTITKVEIKPGELAGALATAIVLQDIENLYLEANISEANISGIKIGQSVEVMFDALGTDKIYTATVQSVDPSSTVISGIVNYLMKASISRTSEVLPGMTANMRVLVEEKPGVLTVPQRAVLTRNGDKFVRVVVDAKTKQYEEREVKIGMFADGGLAVIVSGLEEGQEVVTFISER